MRCGVAVAATVASLLLGAAARAQPGAPPPGPGGFRLDSDPKVETVFGDTAQFKRTVDRFLAVHEDMLRAHEDFSRNVQSVIGSLAAFRQAGGTRCPLDAVAPAYARAFHLGEHYHALGKELEALWSSIRDLDQLGDTRGLTPDYRWKVSRALKLYAQVLTDFREMKVSFDTQLADELRFQGCEPQALISKGDELARAGVPSAPPPTGGEGPRPPALRPPRGKVAGKKAEPPAPPLVASAATFVVDNGTCKGALRVYLDGALLGEVGAGAKAAFRALAGRHELCLIPSTSRQRCGDPGTVRRTFVHDGWTIAMRCD